MANRLTIEIQKLIDQKQTRLTILREEFDRMDANHAGQAVAVQVEINDIAEDLRQLVKMLDTHTKR